MEFLPQENVEKVKKQLKLLFHAFPVEPHPEFLFLCSHPFTDSMHVYTDRFIDLNKPEELEEWTNWIFKRIDKITSLEDIIHYITIPYRLTILKYCKAYLSLEIFSRLLSDCWVATENPNGDVNCSLAEMADWFRAADKKQLMDDDEYATWESFPEEFTIYRGVAVGRKPHGLSWTDKLEVAEWFSHRYDIGDNVGYVQKAIIKKEWALAYLKSRDEYEVVADVSKFRKRIKRM